jgi:hypothetical protein
LSCAYVFVLMFNWQLFNSVNTRGTWNSTPALSTRPICFHVNHCWVFVVLVQLAK